MSKKEEMGLVAAEEATRLPANLPGPRQIESLPAGAVLYCSLPLGESRVDAIAVYNAIGGEAASLADQPGTIAVANVVVHKITLAGAGEGEIVDAVRAVLIGPGGELYAAVSQGVVSSLQKLFSILGEPPWRPALLIRPRIQKTRAGWKCLLLDVVGEADMEADGV